MGAPLHRVPGEAGKGLAVAGCTSQKARPAFILHILPTLRLRPLLEEFADSLFAAVFPTHCCLCDGEVSSAGGLGVCGGCWSGVEAWNGTSCERCGLPIVSERAADSAQVLCGACRTSETSFDQARAFGIYRGNLRLLILHLKFRRRERVGRRLGALLGQAWEKLDGFDGDEPPLIMPVPLFRSRERERGFNQARILAEGLKRYLERKPDGKQLRIESGVLVRTRATRPQAGLKVRARRENVRGAFAVLKPGLVRGRQIVLVDDVMTTGATLSACATVLRKAGAARIYALAMARATPQFPDTAGFQPAEGVDESGRDWT